MSNNKTLKKSKYTKNIKIAILRQNLSASSIFPKNPTDDNVVHLRINFSWEATSTFYINFHFMFFSLLQIFIHMVTLSTCMFSWCKNICLDNLATVSSVTKQAEFISEYQNNGYEKYISMFLSCSCTNQQYDIQMMYWSYKNFLCINL